MIGNIENQGLELKEKVENYRDISKTACAFANSYGGQIKIGITDKGAVVGLQPDRLDEIQKRLEGSIKLVSPIPTHSIGVQEEAEKKIIVVDISRMGEGAFCTYDGVTYYRVGSTNAKLEGRTLQDYLVRKRILYFDESPSDATIEEISPELLKDYLKIRTPELEFDVNKLEDYLLSLGLAKKEGKLCIKSAAILFFAKTPSKFLPQNEIKLVRFKGGEPIEIIDRLFASSTIIANIKEAEDFIRKNIRTRFKIEKLQREEIPEYPAAVIREALVNSFAHRDYFSRDAIQVNIFEDRIEFLNPGNLPNGVSLDILGRISVQRNPLTYAVMRDLHFMEGIGTGIPRMRSGMKDAGLPLPKFEEVGQFFKVTLFNKSPIDASSLNERQKMAIAYLEKYPSIKAKTYRKITKISHPMAVADLNMMISLGLIKKVGKTRGAYYVLSIPV